MNNILKIVGFLLLSAPLMANCGNNNGNGNGCSDDDDVIVGPQGPIGPQGPQGLPGSKGDKGNTGNPGTNGTNGTSGQNGKDGKNGANANVNSSAKLAVDLAVRLYDGKRVQVQAFDMMSLDRRESHDVIGGAQNMVFGARVVFKLGSSYEERLLEAQNRKIEALERRLNGVK